MEVIILSSKAITIGLTIIVIGIFLAYFSALIIFFNGGVGVTNLLNGISQAAQQGDWDRAETQIIELKRELEYKKYLIMLNYANGDMYDFLSSIARLEAAIKIKEETDTVLESATAREIWSNFWKVVPQP